MAACLHCLALCDDAHRFCASCGGSLEIAPESMRADPMVGRALPGGYVVQHLAGIGGMGRVYLAEQTALGRTVAVKVIHPHLAGDEQAAGRFITEARAASRLSHPNTIGIYDFGRTDDGQLYLVMEYLRGKDLARVAEEEGPLPFVRIVDILRQTLGALEEAHDQAIIHRDVKPENIVLEPVRSGKDFVKVVDYGLAKMREATPGAALTMPGFVCGTPEYMSPEQGRGDQLDPRSDLYSIGIILYQLITERLPFEAETPTRLLLAHLHDAPIDPRVVAPHRAIPDALAEVALRALSKDRDARFSSARELSDALAAAIGLDADVGRTCVTCQARNLVAQKFCGECGTPMSFAQRDGSTPPAPAFHASIVNPHAPTLASNTSSMPRAPPSEHPTLTRARAGEIAPFVGRADDMAWLGARREDARAMPCAAHIAGDSGMGKTRLLHEFLARCDDGGDVIVETGPDPSGAKVLGYSVRDAIRRLAGLPLDGGPRADWSTGSAEARRGLEELFVGAASEGASASHGDMTKGERRHAIGEALRWAIVSASERAESEDAMVVVAVDDLDDIDGVSINAFADVMSDPPLVRSLLVVTHTVNPLRTEAGPGELRQLALLEPEIVLALLGPSAPSIALSPLFVEQYMQWTREGGGEACTSVDELVSQRLARLDATTKDVLAALAVFGDDADEHALEWALSPDVEEHEIALALSTLRGARLVIGRRVAHSVVRKAVLASLTEGRRRELHASALALAGSDAPLDLRAHHAAGARDLFHALVLLDEVASTCERVGDHRGAVAALRRALDLARADLAQGVLEDPLSAMVTFGRKLGDALSDAEQYTDAEGVLREALDVAEPTGKDRAHLLAALARVAIARRDQRDAKGYLEQALRLARQSDARELVASLETMGRAIA
jgi:serine/threonine protein kinase